MGKHLDDDENNNNNNIPLNINKHNIVKRSKECQKQLNEEMHLFKIAKKQNNNEENIICEITEETKKIDFPYTLNSFEEMVQLGYPFIDETLLIKDIMEYANKNILITRPRRWMKSMSMDMLKTFLQINPNRSRENIFNGLKIQKHQLFCKEHFGKHPVIFITFPLILLNDYDNPYQQIDQAFRQPIADAFFQHINIYEENIGLQRLSEKDLEKFQQYLDLDKAIDINDGIYFLSELLFEYYEKKVIILIDEFDCPINSLIENEHFDKIIRFMDKLLTINIKNNYYIEKSIFTGVLNIAFQQFLSYFNCLSYCGVNDNQFSQYFGFSQEDVDYLLSKIYDNNHQQQFNQVKEQLKLWYSGYRIGNRKMYNPCLYFTPLAFYVAALALAPQQGDPRTKLVLFQSAFQIQFKVMIKSIDHIGHSQKIKVYQCQYQEK